VKRGSEVKLFSRNKRVPFSIRWKGRDPFALHRFNERSSCSLPNWLAIHPLRETTLSVSDPQQVFPSAKVILEAHTLGDLECRDDTPLDLVAGLAGVKGHKGTVRQEAR
jgi:hypothetical protein